MKDRTKSVIGWIFAALVVYLVCQGIGVVTAADTPDKISKCERVAQFVFTIAEWRDQTHSRAEIVAAINKAVAEHPELTWGDAERALLDVVFLHPELTPRQLADSFVKACTASVSEPEKEDAETSQRPDNGV
jgi:hypothetical protein